MRAAFGYDVDAASKEAAIVFDPDEGMTQQQFAEEADINEIVRRFGMTGQLPENLRVPVSGDFTGIGDFHAAMNAVVNAQEAFMQLPGELRETFGHDPARLIAFMDDPSNHDKAVELGLVSKPPEVTRDVKPADPA